MTPGGDVETVSLIIPVGGPARGFDGCLAGLARLDPQPTETIIVVDGGDPALVAMARASGATVLTLEPGGGPAAARNHGARAAAGDLLLFLDADVVPQPDLVARVRTILGRRPELAAVIGSYDDRPGDPRFLSQYRNLLHHYVHQHGRAEASTFWGACGAVRRAVFEAVDGFDEGFGAPSVEDIELGGRIRHAGHHIALAADLQVKHLKRWGVVDMLRTDLWRRAVPWTRLMLRHGGLVNDLNVTSGARLSVVAAFLLPACLVVAVLWPPALVGGVLAAATLLLLNADLYRFFARRRGVVFALGAVAWHWVYLLVCGLGFAIGAASAAAERRTR